MVPNVYTSLRLRLRLRLLLSPNTLATTYVSRARREWGWGWAGGRGSQNPTLGQCSRHLSWPAACFPAGFSTSIYFPVRLFHCLSVCLSSYLLECILRLHNAIRLSKSLLPSTLFRAGCTRCRHSDQHFVYFHMRVCVWEMCVCVFALLAKRFLASCGTLVCPQSGGKFHFFSSCSQ